MKKGAKTRGQRRQRRSQQQNQSQHHTRKARQGHSAGTVAGTTVIGEAAQPSRSMEGRVGTECDRLDSVYKYDWDFTNLEHKFEEGGKFYGIGNNKVYLFGATETSSPSLPVLIPTLVAVVAPRPPSLEIGIRSIQREGEEIVPMKQMKMDWIPYLLNPNDEAEFRPKKNDEAEE